jgi:hypothetical protein
VAVNLVAVYALLLEYPSAARLRRASGFVQHAIPNYCARMEPPLLKASPKEKFDTLYELLKEHYAGLIDFEFKHGTVLTLLLGWVLASKDARDFLHSYGGVARFVCVAVLLYAAFHSIWVWNFYRRSLLAYTQLCKLGYMPTEYFEKRCIQSFTVVSFIVLHWVVAFLISTVILLT